LSEKRCVLPPNTGIFDRFWTLFDGLFTDPGCPGAAGARRHSATNIDLFILEIILMKRKVQYWRRSGGQEDHEDNMNSVIDNAS
jgi:hypothetical protein